MLLFTSPIGRMENSRYLVSSSLPVGAEEAFAYHERPGALERLIPPWEKVDVESSDGSIRTGSRVTLKSRVLGIPLRWVAEHTKYDPPSEFVDRQVSGPFRFWEHAHRFEAREQSCCLHDSIQYKIPMGWLGKTVAGGLIRRRLESTFSFRHRITRDDLTLKTDCSLPRLRIAISGASGLVGRSLTQLLTMLGHDVQPITRTASAEGISPWSSSQEFEKFKSIDAVVHLAGRPIASQRWSPSVKEEIRESRVKKTRQLCQGLAKLSSPPKVLVCASATGIYGDRGDQVLPEDAESGVGFLAETARDWENACQPVLDAGMRVVNARFGMILSLNDGALSKMLLPAKLFGGALGDGQQWWSWITLDDAVGAIFHCLACENLSGGVNFVSPHPIQNREFAKTLAKVVGRAAIFPAPSLGLKLAMGEMADELLLASTRAVPNRLIESGYRFRFTDLADAFRYSLGYDRLESSQPG